MSWGLGAAPSQALAGQTVRVFPLSSVLLGFHNAFLVVVILTNNVFLSSGVGSFQQYYEIGPLKGYSSTTISWIPSLQLFFLFALGPFVGIIYDKYGPRPLIIGGTLFHVFGLMMASLATEYYQFMLSQGVCSAIGVASLYMPGKFNLHAMP
jgi:MFS family permease